MTDTDKYERTTPELEEFEGENLGDLLTNLLAEVKRLQGILDDYRAFHTWIGERNYDLIAEWDGMESEQE